MTEPRALNAADRRFECDTCHKWPMLRNWPNHTAAYRGHQPILTATRQSPDVEAAALEVAQIAVGVCNDWMGDPDHGFILDPLSLAVDAFILARLTAKDADR